MRYCSLLALVVALNLSTVSVIADVISETESVKDMSGTVDKTVSVEDMSSSTDKRTVSVKEVPDTIGEKTESVEKMPDTVDETVPVETGSKPVSRPFVMDDPVVVGTEVIKITADIESVTVIHNGEEVVIMRHQDQNNRMNPEFTKTSRPCPPYCIRPMTLAPGVETIGELEMLDYLKRIREGDQSILVIDSRAVDQVIKGSIPGAINIPWDVFTDNQSNASIVTEFLTEEESANSCHSPIIEKILVEQLGFIHNDEDKDFAQAKTLVLFCNGPWCKKSPGNIKRLLELGYPSEKLKWYRGGMQAWELFGLTTVTDIPMPWLGL